MLLEISQNSKVNTLCQSLFFNKVAGLRTATLLKKRLWHWCFPGRFVKFLRKHFFTERVRWLLLDMTWGNKIAMLIREVNGTEVNFELKLSKYSKTFRGVVLVKADFYNKKKTKQKKTSCRSREPVFANFLSTYFHWPRNFRFSVMVYFHKERKSLILWRLIFSNNFARIFFCQKFWEDLPLVINQVC